MRLIPRSPPARDSTAYEADASIRPKPEHATPEWHHLQMDQDCPVHGAESGLVAGRGGRDGDGYQWRSCCTGYLDGGDGTGKDLAKRWLLDCTGSPLSHHLRIYRFLHGKAVAGETKTKATPRPSSQSTVVLGEGVDGSEYNLRLAYGRGPWSLDFLLSPPSREMRRIAAQNLPSIIS